MHSFNDSSTNESTVTGTALSAFDLFKDLKLEDREILASSFTMKHYSKNQYVISSAETDTDVHFILSGHVQACAFSENGRQVHFEELTAGMMFGELSAIDQCNRSSDCICITDSSIAFLKRTDFIKIVNEYQIVNTALLLRLASMVRLHLRKVYEFSSFPVAQRVRLELIRMASSKRNVNGRIEFDTVPTHAEIAARINTHREAVTRELKFLEAKNIITWRRGNYIIHDTLKLACNL